MTLSDITAIKLEEDARRHMEIMTLANEALKKEVKRRRATEESLRKSKQETLQLLAESVHMQEQQRLLSRRVLSVQEEERKRISRELHDEISQMLIGVSVHLGTLSQEVETIPRNLRNKIYRMKKLVEQSVDITHRFAHALRPPLLDDLGLIPALHSILDTFMKDTGVRASLKAIADVEKLDIDQRTTFYRVAQEALANVARHAHATEVQVTIKKLPNAVHMQITDNSQAFDVEQVRKSRKIRPLGLIGMRERMEMIGGTVSIQSAPGKGTTIDALLPLKGGAKEPPNHEN